MHVLHGRGELAFSVSADKNTDPRSHLSKVSVAFSCNLVLLFSDHITVIKKRRGRAMKLLAQM